MAVSHTRLSVWVLREHRVLLVRSLQSAEPAEGLGRELQHWPLTGPALAPEELWLIYCLLWAAVCLPLVLTSS